MEKPGKNLSWRKKIKFCKEVVKYYFKDRFGNPFILTNGQAEIVCAILFKEHRRTQIIAPTQYGKSEAVAMALILRSYLYHEPWWVVTGSQPKSDIIMQKVIAHLFDHEDFLDALELDVNTPLDRLKRERSKERIVWKQGGEVRAVTADARNRKRVTDSLTGLGNENIVADEASLIPDDLNAMMLRMLGGYQGGYLVKIGNPFTRGHFLRSWESDKYVHIFIDYHQALAEGRYDADFIEEMRAEPFFEILYECLFPPEDAQDQDGYYRLLTDQHLVLAWLQDGEWEECRKKPSNEEGKEWEAYLEEMQKYGENRLGFDPGEGGDESSGVERNKKMARVVYHQKLKDPMDNVVKAHDLLKELSILPRNLFWDANGIGSGGYSRLKEKGIKCVGVRWGLDKPYEPDKYATNKAEQFWKLRIWFIEGGKVLDKALLDELKNIKYKEDSSGRIVIKPKQKMRQEGIKSPNRADALAMTFDKNALQKSPRVITSS